MERSLINAFKYIVANRPEKIAIITERSQMSYQDILNLVAALEVQVTTHGIRAGQTILFQSNRGELNIAMAILASIKSLTLIFSGISKATLSGIDFDYAITTEPEEAGSRGDIILVDESWFSLIGMVSFSENKRPQVEPASFVFSTSGTTGNPKFCKTGEAPFMEEMSTMSSHPSDEYSKMRFLISAASGSGWAMKRNLWVLLNGGCIISLSEDAHKIPTYVDLYYVTHMAVTPAIVKQIVDLKDVRQYFSSVKEIQLGGAYSSPALVSDLVNMVEADVVISYGASEIGEVCRAKIDPSKPFAENYLGEFFRPDLSVIFVDENNLIIPGATEGLVAFKSDSVQQKEYIGPDAVEVQTGFFDDIFIPGDKLRKEGKSLYYLGRSKNILNLNGQKYSLDTIQSVLSGLFSDHEFAVVAERNNTGLEQLIIYYLGEEVLDLEVINVALRAKFFALEAAAIEKLDRIPLTSTGKVDVQALKSRI
jgi:acyl-coenzyme A synthetase/AMP-(fatty) acid ligase